MGGLRPVAPQRVRASQIAAGPRIPHSLRGAASRVHHTGRLLMNKMELVEHIASRTDKTKTDAAAALEAVLEGITEALKKGDEVRLVGFGTFSVKNRAEAKGRNPTT